MTWGLSRARAQCSLELQERSKRAFLSVFPHVYKREILHFISEVLNHMSVKELLPIGTCKGPVMSFLVLFRCLLRLTSHLR